MFLLLVLWDVHHIRCWRLTVFTSLEYKSALLGAPDVKNHLSHPLLEQEEEEGEDDDRIVILTFDHSDDERH